MNVPFLDLERAHAPLRTELERALGGVLDSGQFILGPETERLEGEIASTCGVSHAVAVASGTDALYLALRALEVKPGDEVITTPFSFIATATAIARTGARPVFCDIDGRSFNLDPERAGESITGATRTILPVDLFGLPADWDALQAIGREREITLVEDAAQSIGADAGGRPAGSFGNAAAISFYPTKNLGGMGDGGIVVTGEERIASRVRLLRTHADQGGYRHVELGINSRLDAFQAAVLRVKLRHLREWTSQRRTLAARYTRILSELLDLGGAEAGPITLPGGEGHAYHLYVIRAESRDRIADHLRGSGIGCGIYYPVPLHLQPCFSELGYRQGSLPETERASGEVLALPLFPGLTEPEQDRVCEAVAGFYGGRP